MAHTIVLIVDDDEVCENLRDVLTAHGFTVANAASGRDGLAVLASVDSPCFVLIDLVMPDMMGWEVLAEIDRSPRLSRVPVYIWTSLPERAPPGRRVLPKPVDAGALIREIQCHCSR